MPLTAWPAVRPRVVLAIFASVAVLSTVAEAIVAAVRGPATPFGETVARQGFIWMLFGVLSLAAMWAAQKFPLERTRLARSLPVHLATFVAISMTHTLLYVSFIRFVLRPELGDAEGPLLANLLGNLRGDVFIYGMMIGGYYIYSLIVRRRMLTPMVGIEAIRRIPLKEDGVVAFIDTSDVESIEADGDYVKLNGRFGTRVIRQSLTALEKQLDPKEFARVHRSTIVSLASIKELQPYFHGEFVAIMSSGAKVKVSRTHSSALASALGVRG